MPTTWQLPPGVIARISTLRERTKSATRYAQSRLIPGRQHLWRLAGQLRGREPAVVAAVVSPPAVEDLTSFFFNGEGDFTDLGAVAGVLRTMQIPRGLKEEATVTVTEALLGLRTKSSPDDLLVQPWMDAVSGPIGDYAQFLQSTVSENVRRSLKKAEKEGLLIRTSGEWSDAQWFYDSLQTPFSYQRFGKSTQITPVDRLKAWYSGRTSRGEVAFLERDGRRIAGAALVWREAFGQVLIWAYGALPEVVEHKTLRSGFTALLNQHVYQEASRRGLRVNLGLTRPFLDDGVYAYKRQWGCSLQPSFWRRYRLVVAPGAGEGIRQALAMTTLTSPTSSAPGSSKAPT